MKIAVAGDHAGFALKNLIVAQLELEGHEALDLGAYNAERSDYPDFAKLVGEAVQQGRVERGILVCGSGVGASVAANKVRGIRACVCHDTYSAHQGVEHDDMNILVLGSRVIGVELAYELIHAFLSAKFNQGARYIERLKKIEAMEKGS